MKGTKMLVLICAVVFVCSAILTACGHEHIWIKGVCTECGENCEHAYTDEGVCSNCSMECSHRFIGDTCKKCGRKTMFRWEHFGDDNVLDNECAHKGSITEVTYSTKKYIDLAKGDTAAEMEKTMYVYTPYGYDETKQYNVLVLLHGIDETEGYWFAQGGYDKDKGYGAITNFTVNLLDNMIDQGLCDPLIVVTPTIFYDAEDSSMDNVEYFHMELQNDILPYIAENFATYANSGAAEDLIAARDHMGLGGFSMGAMTTWRAGITKSLPYFAYYATYSAGAVPDEETGAYDELIDVFKNQYSPYPIKYWFHANGTNDYLHDSHVMGYQYMLENASEYLKAGEGSANGNTCFVDIPKGVHAYPSWIVHLYDTLLVLFE